jgi:Fe/S biogenesis protein NfuA
VLQITPTAHARIQASLEGADPPRTHLRIEVHPGVKGFEYRLAAAEESDVGDGDSVVDQGSFRVVIDAESARWLAGARLDWRETLLESGFRFDNPNSPPTPAIPSGMRDDLRGSAREKVLRILDSEINPAVAAHGGRVELAGVENGVVFLRFGGGCHGCGLVDVTLKQGVEARIKELVPEIERVVDTTDHAAGQTPFYS